MREHIRSNLVAYTALFVALGGTAWAAVPLAGKNSVNSSAIVNGQVKRADIAASAVTSAKVANGTLKAVDFAPGTLLEGPRGPQGPPGATSGGGGAPSGPAGGDLAGTYPKPLVGPNAIGSGEVTDSSLTASDLASGSVGTSEVVNNSLSGDDVDESSLGEVPAASVGGLGRRSDSRSCDPESEAFVVCAVVALSPRTPSRVLLIATVSPRIEPQGDADVGLGACRLTSTAGPFPGTLTVFRLVRRGGDSGAAFPEGVSDHATLISVTPVLSVNRPLSFGIECQQNQQRGAISYIDASIAAVGLSPS